MPFPAGVQTVTVTAGASGYRALDGTPYTGSLRFTPSVSRVVSAEHGVIALGPVNVTLGASGQFTQELLATDAAGFTPSGWTYRIDENFTNAPGRAWNVSLPAAVPSVALPSLSPVEASSGTVSAPAVTSVNGRTGVVTGLLDATSNLSDLASAGTARANLGLGSAAVLNVGTTAGTVAAGDDARLSNARTPTPHAASHGSAGSDPITVAQSQVTGLSTALAAKADGAPLAADNALARFDGTSGKVLQNSTVIVGDDGSVTITGNLLDAGDLTVRNSHVSPTKAYRFRSSGGALDTEFAGNDWYWSNFPNPDFTGTQRTYMRWENGAAIIHLTAELQCKADPFGARVHTLDGAGNRAGFFGAAPVGRQTVAGSRASGAALQSLLTAMVNLGFITDSTTA